MEANCWITQFSRWAKVHGHSSFCSREVHCNGKKNYIKRTSSEEKASGIAPDELSDYEKALEEIIAKFVDIELCVAKERETNAKAIEKERETSTDMRQQCIETFSETN